MRDVFNNPADNPARFARQPTSQAARQTGSLCASPEGAAEPVERLCPSVGRVPSDQPACSTSCKAGPIRARCLSNHLLHRNKTLTG